VKKQLMESTAPADRPNARWARNTALAHYLGITVMGLWKWQHDPELAFPQPTVINRTCYTDLDEVDTWMRARVVDLTKQRIARRRKAAA